MIVLILALLVLWLDQQTKRWILAHFIFGQSQEIIPGLFNLTHVRNTGAVWGSFQQHNIWLILFSMLALGVIALLYRYLIHNRGINQIALGLMVGGIIGNLVDRIRLGWVIDFLDFYWRGNHWPAFNVADAAICLGVLGYLFTAWRVKST